MVPFEFNLSNHEYSVFVILSLPIRPLKKKKEYESL